MRAITRPTIGNGGFTIVELLVATLVFSVVLLVVSSGVLTITRQYYKGVTASNTQATARTIINQIAQSIQFDSSAPIQCVTATGANVDYCDGAGTAPDPFPEDYCIGTRRFAVQRFMRTNQPANHALITDTGVTNCRPVNFDTLQSNHPDGSLPSNDTAAGGSGLIKEPRELLGPNMQLAKFSIVQSPANSSLYTITVRVVYGDPDLLCSPSQEATDHNCDPGKPGDLDQPDLSCRQTAGGQFCAASELTTTVQQRFGTGG